MGIMWEFRSQFDPFLAQHIMTWGTVLRQYFLSFFNYLRRVYHYNRQTCPPQTHYKRTEICEIGLLLCHCGFYSRYFPCSPVDLCAEVWKAEEMAKELWQEKTASELISEIYFGK